MPHISKATEYNWRKLGSDEKTRLTKRANKTRSTRRVVATNYLDDPRAEKLLSAVADIDVPAERIMYSLVVSYLTAAGIMDKEHVRRFIARYEAWGQTEINVPDGVWDIHEDVLGFVYQSLLAEGERNRTGQYYTPRKVVEYILGDMKLGQTETFLDPCCGSGAFLMGVNAADQSNIYGFDINPVAVMLAAANLLVKYHDVEFTPKVYCLDFLNTPTTADDAPADIPERFDYIYTNPPWGSDKERVYADKYPQIKSKEKASMVMVRALERLNATGTLCCLLPTSLLKIKTHGDIRKILLSGTAIQGINLFTDNFDGVFTDYFSIRLTKGAAAAQNYTVNNGIDVENITLSAQDMASGHIVLKAMSRHDISIVGKINALRHDDLTHSEWALGIVTGDNKNKIKNVMAEGMEPIYIGKQVCPFNLNDGNSYISFNPDTFQQCAREEYYRAPEKLVYRFIAKYPIVAYDDRQRLCLNSANILIPDVDGISVKSVAALLNSSLYRYYYSLKFHDIKVLKGNLMALPFPKLTPAQNLELSRLVTHIQATAYTEEQQDRLDGIVYSIFGISEEEQNYIKMNLE